MTRALTTTTRSSVHRADSNVPATSRRRWHAAALAIGLAALVGIGVPSASAQSGPRIRQIQIRSENVFEDAETSLLARVADGLHSTTREEVIRRELLFSEGESLDSARVAETERNLRALGLFRSVEIRTEPVGDEEVDLIVRTRDAWTTEVSGSLGRVGGRSKFGVGLEETNFLGFGKKLSLDFASNSDRTTRQVVYSDPQFLGRRLLLDLVYANSSDGERRHFELARPFRSLDGGSAALLDYEDGARETRVYDRGSELARFGMETRSFEISAGRRLTVDSSRPVARLSAGYRREEAAFTLERGAADTLPNDRKFGFFFARFDLLNPDFLVKQDIANLSRDEDFDVGGLLSLELAYSAPLLGARERFAAALRLARGARLPNGLLIGSLSAKTREHNGSLEHSLAEAELEAYWKPPRLPDQTLAGRLLFSWGRRLDREVQLAADGASGLRGYRLHAFTGDRRLIANLEDRIRLTPELLHLFQLGAAVFVDAGYAWPAGSPIRLSDLRVDAGVGLRIALPRAARHALLRFDVAYALRPDLLGRRGWLVSFSSSQAF
jgi:Surface antigen variable number repeat/Omp85 superfamily domain